MFEAQTLYIVLEMLILVLDAVVDRSKSRKCPLIQELQLYYAEKKMFQAKTKLLIEW